MAELLFKKGLHANLAAATKKAGTLYVTTDEKCLYMDISDTERIRLQGSVLYYSTLEEFYNNARPPYSTDVIYFIEKAQKRDEDGNVVAGEYTAFNALMRWNGSEWIQLNATAASVDAAIADLQRQITANAGTLTAHGTAIEGALNRISVLEGYVGAPAHKNDAGEDVAASGLHAAVATNANDIDAIETAIGDDNTAGSIKGRIKAVEGEIGTDTTEGSVKYRVKTAENAIDALEEIVETLATKKEVEDLDKDLQDQIDAINAELGDPTTDNKPAAEGTVWHAIEANIEAIAEINETLGDGSGTGSITSRLTAVEGKASDNTAAIEGLATKVGIPETPAYDEGISNLYGQVTKNKADIADHEGRVDALETAVGDANSGLVKKAEDNRLATVKNAEDIGKNAQAIKDVSDALDLHAENAAKTYETIENVAKIKTELDGKILAANAMRYIGTAASKADLGKGIDISVGDTYVASTDLYNDDNSLFAHAGDLIIAKGTEVDGVISAESLIWDVVDTGYVRAHENKLVLEQADGSTLVHLKNYADQDVSSFAIKSTSANVAVAAKDSTVEISLQWAEF